MRASPARTSATLGGAGFFLIGTVSLLAQTVLVREALFAFHGGEIGLGLFYAAWLAGIALGAALGTAHLGRQPPATAAAAAEHVRLGLALFTWVALAQIAVWRLHRAILPVEAGGYLPAPAYLALLAAAALPAAALTGWLFTLGLQAWAVPAGRAYALESLGSMAGGSAAALWALSRMPHASVVALGAPLVLLWSAWPAGRAFPPPAPPPRARAWPGWIAVALSGAATLALLTGALGRLDALTSAARWQQLATGTRAVASIETPYHQVTVGTLGREASLYLDGLYQGALDDPYVDSLAAAAILTQHPAPRRVLLLAPALYGAGRVMAGGQGVALTVARTDPGVDRAIALAAGRVDAAATARTTAARTADPVPAAGTVGALAADPVPAAGTVGARAAVPVPAAGTAKVLTADPRSAVRSAEPPPDLIAILHGGAATGSENRVYTREFFAICARALAPGGVLVITLPGAANVETEEGVALRGATWAALRESFADVRLAPGTTSYFFAAQPRPAEGPSPLTWQPEALAARRARLWPGGRAWPAGVFAALFPADRVEALASRLATTEGRVAPNSDRRPAAYYHQLRRWDRFSGSGLGGLLDAWHAAPWPLTLALFAFLSAAGWGVRRRWGQPAASLASTGAAGMGASLLVLLLFQTSLGTLYLRVGLVNALFMAGLGLGSLAASRWRGATSAERRAGPTPAAPQVGPAPGRAPRPLKLLAVCDGLWVVALLALVPLTGVLISWNPHAREAGLCALAAILGLLTGTPFPLAAAALSRSGPEADVPGARGAVAGGTAEAADHAGAVFGALLTGTLLVPLLGFSATLALLAALKALSLAGTLAARS